MSVIVHVRKNENGKPSWEDYVRDYKKGTNRTDKLMSKNELVEENEKKFVGKWSFKGMTSKPNEYFTYKCKYLSNFMIWLDDYPGSKLIKAGTETNGEIFLLTEDDLRQMSRLIHMVENSSLKDLMKIKRMAAEQAKDIRSGLKTDTST